jgi:MoaA/NifB/PqqE/SkfB family radical SAM enzyme
MYLQITTKCNMKCSHCCYSCSTRGKHGEYNTIVDAVAFSRDYTDSISIGGGEPTIHPRFFDILKICLEDFDYVWMATNGSRTDVMWRLANIINQEDYLSFDGICKCETEEEMDYCSCYDLADYIIYQEDKLGVALSLDPWHDPIDQQIIDYWNRRANIHKNSNFQIRDVSRAIDGVSAQGRAKKNQIGHSDHCPCPDILIKPDGKLKICGCTRAPIIGDVWSGYEEKWEKVLEDDAFRDVNCYRQWRKLWQTKQ